MTIPARLLPVVFILCSMLVEAETGPEDLSGQTQSAHVHGVASLTVAVDATQVEIVFDSPVANLTGFEHEPATPAETASWNKLQQWLQQGLWLQWPQAAQCQLKQADLTQPWGRGDDAATVHHHADLTVTLSYSCQQPEALTDVQLLLFSAAADLQQMNVQWVRDMQQGAARLTPAQPKLRLSGD